MAARGTSTRGSKNPALLAPVRAPVDEIVAYVCGAKPLLMGELTLTEGVEVPGAATWPRLEAWVTSRRVRPVKDGEEFTSFEDFAGMTHEDYMAQLEVEKIEAEAAAEEAAQAEDADTEE